MSSPGSGARPPGLGRRRHPAADALAGVVLLARGRAEGIGHFTDTPRAFLRSFAPLLLAAMLLPGASGLHDALSGRASALCALLAQPVLSHAAARFWGREAAWLRYAVAGNWCQWLLPALFALLLVLAELLMLAGLDGGRAGGLLLLGLGAYGLWLQWFLGRAGLGLTRLQAVLLVGWVTLGTFVLAFAPALAGG